MLLNLTTTAEFKKAVNSLKGSKEAVAAWTALREVDAAGKTDLLGHCNLDEFLRYAEKSVSDLASKNSQQKGILDVYVRELKEARKKCNEGLEKKESGTIAFFKSQIGLGAYSQLKPKVLTFVDHYATVVQAGDRADFKLVLSLAETWGDANDALTGCRDALGLCSRNLADEAIPSQASKTVFAAKDAAVKWLAGEEKDLARLAPQIAQAGSKLSEIKAQRLKSKDGAIAVIGEVTRKVAEIEEAIKTELKSMQKVVTDTGDKARTFDTKVMPVSALPKFASKRSDAINDGLAELNQMIRIAEKSRSTLAATFNKANSFPPSLERLAKELDEIDSPDAALVKRRGDLRARIEVLLGPPMRMFGSLELRYKEGIDALGALAKKRKAEYEALA